jgi:hypothetical protein
MQYAGDTSLNWANHIDVPEERSSVRPRRQADDRRDLADPETHSDVQLQRAIREMR